MISASLLLATATFAPATTIEVVDVARSVSFAGKYGKEVREVVTVDVNGSTFKFQLPRYHTRFGTPSLELNKGDKITIAKWDGQAIVDRSAIKKI